MLRLSVFAGAAAVVVAVTAAVLYVVHRNSDTVKIRSPASLVFGGTGI